MLPPFSLSVYTMILKFSEVEYIMSRPFVPLTYLIILLLACECESLGDSMILEIRITPYMMSSLIAVKYIRLPTSLLNSVGSTVDPSSSLLNFKSVITGVWAVLQLDMLNIFKTSLSYLDCDINIPLLYYWNSIPRKKIHKP